MTIYIYKLVHPKTYKPLYVGATQNPKLRLCAHLTKSSGFPKIVQLREEGFKVKLIILEECNVPKSKKREQFWIEHFERKGIKLLNRTKKPTYSKNIGRNKISDKKVCIRLYVRESQIKKLGGEKVFTKKAYELLNTSN